MEAPEEVSKRIERLSLYNGGQHLGIIFLLNEKDMRNGFPAYIQLQTMFVLFLTYTLTKAELS
jgi:hypothetical protein